MDIDPKILIGAGTAVVVVMGAGAWFGEWAPISKAEFQMYSETHEQGGHGSLDEKVTQVAGWVLENQLLDAEKRSCWTKDNRDQRRLQRLMFDYQRMTGRNYTRTACKDLIGSIESARSTEE